MATPDSKPEPSIGNVDRPPPTQLYRYKFFSPEAAPARRALLPGVVLPLIFNAILMWACLSLFFGSLLQSNNTSKISVTAVNLDDGFVGKTLISGVNKSLEMSGPHLEWHLFDWIGAVDGDDRSKELVLDEKSWAVLQVSSDASTALQYALFRGDSSYDPLSALTLYITSARNQITTLSAAIPAIQSLINPILSQIAANSTSTFLTSIADNATALSIALKCPQCLASPLAIKVVDLIPFSSPTAFGALNTGVIFLLTFTFNTFTILRAGAAQHGSLFRLRSQLLIRTTTSLLSYLFLSLTYSLIILAFSVPLVGHFPDSRASGFFVLWMLNFCTMGACGLVMEAVCTVTGMEWAPFVLNIWLIANASGSFASFELMPGFFEYGYAMPFYHCIQATRTIAFGTKSHLGLNFGVLIAWMVVGLGGVYLATTWRVKKGLKTGVHLVP